MPVPLTVAQEELVQAWVMELGKSILMRPEDRIASVVVMTNEYVVFWLTRLLLGVTVKVRELALA